MQLMPNGLTLSLSLFQGLGAYSVSKTALFGMTKALSEECAPMNIRVNCVAPGIIKTNFSAAVSSATSSIVNFCLSTS